MVPFIVTPALCTQLLLGLPWLLHNHIVIDYASRSCIHKPLGIDLLNPLPVPRMFLFKSKSVENVQTTLRKSANQAREARRDFVAKLTEVCPRIRPKFPLLSVSPTTSTSDTIASIRAHIKDLATLNTLHDHETRLKQKYHTIFEPIPHVDDLLTTVIAKIQLIDAAKSISSHSYCCPHKFRSAWQTLIQKHLDSGKICASDSPYASPSFVIPKSDPNALPRWVAD